MDGGRVGALSAVVGLDRFPEAMRALVTLPRVDYCDLHTVTTRAAQDRSPEGWARAILEDAPLSRRSAYRLWRLLGLRLGPRGAADHVQGWAIAGRGRDWIRLQTASWYVAAQAVVAVEDGRVAVGLFLRHRNPVAALVWTAVGPMHRRGVPQMLRQAVDATSDRRGAT